MSKQHTVLYYQK